MDIKKIRFLFNKILNIVDDEINLLDDKGYIIESSNFEKIGEYDNKFNFKKINNNILSAQNTLYYPIIIEYGKTLIISIKGNEYKNKKLLQVIGLFLTENFKKLTKDDFIKGIIFEEFSKDEIKEFSGKFGIQYNSKAKVFLIKISEDNIDDVENIISNIYPEEIVIRLDGNTLAFIKIIGNDEYNDEIPRNIYDTIFSELLYEPIIGVGTTVQNIIELNESYKRANILIKLGKKFINNNKIYDYDDLLLPIVIDKLDINSLKDLIKSSDYNLEEILADNELLLTADKFLENSLNISDTARKLYIHRNTLIYRLNKIENITGLDLRIFKDAVNFSILMTGMKYL
ncbi:PucR family transcriptional regulator [Maledivibacter halophilus]|uniref:Transcriptional regulator, CdaR family n=1 Tax=Maledivibacter halophilus TaxID=36842 RepID=A0A1T5IGQ4_9FIRM|nr:helix-turn-helix domain-containing protein [Maledivibacter halophilus]SKC38248.1 transcriptional regulator, CdaR family [Maledivibacter halophilus]